MANPAHGGPAASTYSTYDIEFEYSKGLSLDISRHKLKGRRLSTI
jgi:hypothetical protein